MTRIATPLLLAALILVTGCGTPSRPPRPADSGAPSIAVKHAPRRPRLSRPPVGLRHYRARPRPKATASHPDPNPGDSLSASTGTWTHTPTSFSYQWEDCDTNGLNCAPIPGATSASYTVTSSDTGSTIVVVVTAHNQWGSSSAASSSTTVVGAGCSCASLQPIDGGTSYFADKAPSSAWMDQHILVGAWQEQPQSSGDLSTDSSLGENLYWNLSGSSVDFNVINAAGMHISAPSTDANTGSETVAYDGQDESDLNFGPGSNTWINNQSVSSGYTWNQAECVPTNSQCGFSAAAYGYSGSETNVSPATFSPAYSPLLPNASGRVVHQGYGTGVLFFEGNTDAATFARYSDIESADSYWMSDPSLDSWNKGGCALLPNNLTACNATSGTGALTDAQRALPANYAYDVSRFETLDNLNGARKPIMVDIETSCPFSSANCINVPQIQAATWQSLIAGARGIIWFQHDFFSGTSPSCGSDFRAFYDGENAASGYYSCTLPAGDTPHQVDLGVQAVSSEISSLNSVLLSPTATGEVSTSADVSVMAKAAGGNTSCYVFAGSGQPANPPGANLSATMTLADHYSGTVTPVDATGTALTPVTISSGVFTDTFADQNAIHIYHIPAAC